MFSIRQSKMVLDFLSKLVFYAKLQGFYSLRGAFQILAGHLRGTCGMVAGYLRRSLVPTWFQHGSSLIPAFFRLIIPFNEQNLKTGSPLFNKLKLLEYWPKCFVSYFRLPGIKVV